MTVFNKWSDIKNETRMEATLRYHSHLYFIKLEKKIRKLIKRGVTTIKIGKCSTIYLAAHEQLFASHSSLASISSSSRVPYARYIFIINANATPRVLTITTIAVSIRTWGSGFT